MANRRYNDPFDSGRSSIHRDQNTFHSDRIPDWQPDPTPISTVRGPREQSSLRSPREEDRHRLSSRHDESFMDYVNHMIENNIGKGPKGYKRSDERIREDVSEALYKHPQIDASNIEVDVKDSIVILKGSVERRQTKRMIEDVAEACSGVTDVNNQIRVTPSSSLFPEPNRAEAEAAGWKGKSPIP